MGAQHPGQVAHIARDPLDPLFDDAAFLARSPRRASGVKRVLLDQTLVSGIGNIYADEALWAARMHGEQPASSLSRAARATLLAEVRDVLGKALAEGGTSFDEQYVNVNGHRATSRTRSTPTAGPGCRARAAARRSCARRS